LDGVNQYTCVCQEGFTGQFCENELTATTPTSIESSSTEMPSSEGTSGPSPIKPITEDVNGERKTDFTLEIRISEEWDDRLGDTSSKKFKELANRMQQQIRKAYSGGPELKEVKIISMRKGSIIAVFQLTFKVKVTAEVALNPLKKETADGRLGSLKVDRGSLKETDAKKADDDDDDRDEKPSINKPVIIGASIGGFVVVAVLMIGLYVSCKRTRLSHGSVGDGDGMPNDDDCEKYELEPTEDEKGNVLWMEGNGFNNEGAE